MPQKHDADCVGPTVAGHGTAGVRLPDLGKAPVFLQGPAGGSQRRLICRRVDNDHHLPRIRLFLGGRPILDILRHYFLQASAIFFPYSHLPIPNLNTGLQLEQIGPQRRDGGASAALSVY